VQILVWKNQEIWEIRGVKFWSFPLKWLVTLTTAAQPVIAITATVVQQCTGLMSLYFTATHCNVHASL